MKYVNDKTMNDYRYVVLYCISYSNNVEYKILYSVFTLLLLPACIHQVLVQSENISWDLYIIKQDEKTVRRTCFMDLL